MATIVKVIWKNWKNYDFLKFFKKICNFV